MEARDSWVTIEETTLSGGRIGRQLLWVTHVTVKLIVCQQAFAGAPRARGVATGAIVDGYQPLPGLISITMGPEGSGVNENSAVLRE